MRRNIFAKTFIVTFGLAFLFCSASSAPAQVKQIEMHIAGYLCGN